MSPRVRIDGNQHKFGTRRDFELPCLGQQFLAPTEDRIRLPGDDRRDILSVGGDHLQRKLTAQQPVNLIGQFTQWALVVRAEFVMPLAV